MIISLFLGGIAVLLAGYFFYWKLVTKALNVQPSGDTPANAMKDGVDYVPMGKKRNAFIQLLNIAGVGPIFGPIAGAFFGPWALVMIPVGAVIGGATHDMLAGFMSLKNGGRQIPNLGEKYLGAWAKYAYNIILGLLLLFVGVVFITAPAGLLAGLFGETALVSSKYFWTVFILGYYVVATLLPIDKIIGKAYPVIGGFLVFSALAMLIAVFINSGTREAITGIGSMDIPVGKQLFPMFFMTVSCGLLSGFHATQSPVIARTIENEEDTRPVFFGMMLAEGFIAMIWALVTIAFIEMLGNVDPSTGINWAGGTAVSYFSKHLLGNIAGIFAIIGVIALPITSGDTSFRGLRLQISEFLGIDQKKSHNRLVVALPLFGIAFAIMVWSYASEDGFNLLWQYFSFFNQSSATLMLLIGGVFIATRSGMRYVALAFVPLWVIGSAVVTYIFFDAKSGFGLEYSTALTIGLVAGTWIVTYGLLKAQKMAGVDISSGSKPVDKKTSITKAPAKKVVAKKAPAKKKK